MATVNAALHFMDAAAGGGTPGTITGTSAANTLNGTTGNDTINGLGGNDTLNGNAGNDTLDGGTGADAMKGGTGNDIYYVDNSGDRVTELLSAGTMRCAPRSLRRWGPTSRRGPGLAPRQSILPATRWPMC